MYCVPDNFIPFRLDECGNINTSPSGYYVDDMPGVTLYSAGKILNLEYYLQTKQFITDKIQTAVLDVKTDIVTAFNMDNKFTFNNNVRYFQTDTKSQDYTAHTLQVTNNDRFGLEIFRIWSGEYLTKCSIDYIDIDFGNSDNYILYIEELNQVTQYPFVSIANQTVRIATNYLIKNWSYNFYTTSNHNDSVKVYVINTTNGTTFMQNHAINYQCGQSCINTDFFKISGYTNTQLPNAVNEMHGLNAGISLQCDYDGFFCSVLPYVTDLIYYRLAYYIYLEALYTNRLNSITLDKVKLRELYEWSKLEYKNSLIDTIASSIGWIKTIKSECIICNQSKSYFSI